MTVVRSSGCGLEWLSPFPDEASGGAIYGENYLDRWGIDGPATMARVRAMKESSYRAFFKEVRAHRRSGRLLDIGCALGFLLGVAKEEGFDPYGLDLNADAVQFAQREFGERVQTGSPSRHVFAGLQFDVITMIDVLEHVPEPRSFLLSIGDCLAPDGIVVAVLPNASALVKKILGRHWPHYAPEHLYYWSPGNLSRFLWDCGWEVRAVRNGVRKTFTAGYLKAYSACLGGWLPPGLGLLGNTRLRIPTGEMLVIAGPRPRMQEKGDSLER